MTVYIELLIIDNFVFDFLIAYITLAFLKAKKHVLCILLSAAIGTVFAVFFPFVTRRILIIYKLTSLVLSAIVLKKYKSIKEFIAVILVYIVTSTALAGIVVLLFNMKTTSLYGAFVYDKGGMIAILSLAAVIGLYTARQLKGLYQEKRIESSIINATIHVGQSSINIKGLLDTGNRLIDENGQGVIILSDNLSKRLEKSKRGTEILISTINGQNIFDTIIIDELKIYYKDKVNTINYVTAALTERDLGNYDAILFDS